MRRLGDFYIETFLVLLRVTIFRVAILVTYSSKSSAIKLSPESAMGLLLAQGFGVAHFKNYHGKCLHSGSPPYTRYRFYATIFRSVFFANMELALEHISHANKNAKRTPVRMFVSSSDRVCKTRHSD